MSVWEILLIGVALSMDAFAVGLSDGLAEPNMRAVKWFLVAFAFGFFQFGMPVLGYYCGYAFASLVAKIAPYLSFALLLFIGGKMVLDYISEYRARAAGGKPYLTARSKDGLTFPKLIVQAIATSLDALAVGVTMLAAETSAGLPYHVTLCAFLIGAVTFSLSSVAVFLGKKVGNNFSDEATLAGGLILITIGTKLLLEGVL